VTTKKPAIFNNVTVCSRNLETDKIHTTSVIDAIAMAGITVDVNVVNGRKDPECIKANNKQNTICT
jgi:hypothetical protein